jgi:hypothetical protein
MGSERSESADLAQQMVDGALGNFAMIITELLGALMSRWEFWAFMVFVVVANVIGNVVKGQRRRRRY